MSKEMSYQGRIVVVVERNGGWTTILDGMKQIKVRNGELTAPVDGKPNIPAKPGKLLSTQRKERKERKAAKAPKAKPEPAAEGTEKATPPRLVNPDLSRYVVSDVRTASGRKAIDRNDEVANLLRGMDLAGVYGKAAEVLGVSVDALKAQYLHLNPGMQRMNLGNRIRGALSKAAKARGG